MLNKFIRMVNNVVVRYFKEQKQDVACDENLLHFGLKAICFAGLFPYEKICNTPSKLKLYRAFQITLYILYCSIFFSQIVKLYMMYEDLHVAIEIITHIVMGVSTYIIMAFINWNKVYKMICQIDTFIPKKCTTQIDRNTTEILRETQQKLKYTSLFVILFGEVLLVCDLYDIFILHFVENLVGVEHKYKRNPNAANVFESLLLQKYPFSCWTPFDETSVTVHLAMYIYTTIPVLMGALKAGSFASVFFSTMIYSSLQFKFVSKSLEDLSNMEDSESSKIEHNTFSTIEKQHTCEEFIHRNCQVSATDSESFQTPSQEQISECSNVQQYRDTSITTAHCVKDEEHINSDRLLSDKKSSPEDYLKTIIKNHQEALRFAEECDKVWSNALFFLQFLTAWIFIAGLFQIAMNVDFSTTLKAVLCAGYGFSGGGLVFYFGELVKTQSTTVSDAAYSVPWYNYSTKFKKMLQMVIMRAQRPSIIHLGPLFPLTMEHFQKGVNASYSYFTLLLHVMKKQDSA